MNSARGSVVQISTDRAKLTQLRTGLKGQVHAVLGKEGVIPVLREMWGTAGFEYLNGVRLGQAYEIRLESLRDLIEILDKEIHSLDAIIHRKLKDDHGYRAIQHLNGVGPVPAAIFCAEIGDVSRFPNPQRLCSWVGLTPRLRESDTKNYRGGITKLGSALVRWSAVEAVSRYHGGPPIRGSFRRIADRRGRNVARVAAARKLLTLVYYGLRDGEIRCLPDLNAPKSKRSRTLAREGLVCDTPNGFPLDPANVRRVIRHNAAAAGIDGVVTPYDLRHTATSVLSATGVAAELLADLLGHVDTRMVFRHHRHPVTPTIDGAAHHIERAIKA